MKTLICGCTESQPCAEHANEETRRLEKVEGSGFHLPLEHEPLRSLSEGLVNEAEGIEASRKLDSEIISRSDAAPIRFQISPSCSHDSYYMVSIPSSSYRGGEVVNAEAYDAALEALRPFAKLDDKDTWAVIAGNPPLLSCSILLSDLKRARAVIAKAEGGG